MKIMSTGFYIEIEGYGFYEWLIVNMDEQSKITFDEEKITTLLKSVFIDEYAY